LNYWKISFGCLAGLVLAVASCSHPGGGSGTGSGGSNGSGGSGSCTVGTLGCPCDGTASCDDGLSCAALPSGQTCVSTSSGSGGDTGTGGSGTGGAVSSGGNTGTGGAASGGNTGTGGGAAGATGTGGAATGGNTGTGGGAAGSPGTGGAATGGSTGSGGSSPTNNLITNGDFSQGMTNWNLTGSPSSSGVNNGEYCMMVTMAQGQIILGWGGSTTSLNLMANVAYTLTYQARASNGATVDVHIGQAVGSFNLDKDLGNDSPGSGTQTFTKMFTLTTADPQAGVAFLVSTSSTGGSMVCFDNLVVTQN
jgi:hypothetical protein